MKKSLLFAITLVVSAAAFAQSPSVEISRDASGNKVLKGFIDKKQLANDTAFAWYPQNAAAFTPAADVIKQYAAYKDSINLVVFGGTWCGDTKFILPRFFATTDAAGIADNRITLIGVDHDKKTLFHLTEAFGVTHVPTIIVMKNGREVGRVVEYGKTGSPEKEVAEMLRKRQ